MKLLSIETSCDETAVSVLHAEGPADAAQFRILGNTLLSQIDIHKQYGGVFPALAKREHAKNLVPILSQSLAEANLLVTSEDTLSEVQRAQLSELLTREPELCSALTAFFEMHRAPAVDAICVTHGPGLAPALWVGVNFARALSLIWNIPVIGVNHMEGHLLSALVKKKDDLFVIEEVAKPVLALLISGGHTELLSMKDWLSYELIGHTRDDAVGEAYDKVARMLDLPYPGGPEVSRLAEEARAENIQQDTKLPRPMIYEQHADFSFSGLKTAVLYFVKAHEKLSEEDRKALAREFEDAVADVLFTKTSRALLETGAQTLVLGGGVSANKNIQRVFTEKISAEHPDVELRIPAPMFTTDNALMIGIAGYYRALANQFSDAATLAADGNLSLV
ncbi:tRNA (adenosine(37)-N6)-threonylcarbamoyltransferase complex transferase subunit TsaD [Patescibacteria group bacterium]|nr:tRNA (adenosine(37)-N6)-threonylcarbamoyltransferase complex transferase subunit TsaD [Patescibacteria group bacterium]MBU1500763.1 tRNA (adenosine(37)-N6)-threonylcarbamoyltransferase complex transferase subunit TsaD [Patescibacteria group bacterium]MBU2080818.1 tRNA (adenosine(37)-N6)-threonylcarbamoyltransferase complex transferase subunit TsaD [Patescibacteria group bacterium]MBU2123923.1 tRNA (adenosine(37)-N6)-threonylcarbamoyltransferase complex transferase subunit TsaD [Patescibacteri